MVIVGLLDRVHSQILKMGQKEIDEVEEAQVFSEVAFWRKIINYAGGVYRDT